MKVIDIRLVVTDETTVNHVMVDAIATGKVLGAVELVNDGFGRLLPGAEQMTEPTLYSTTTLAVIHALANGKEG